MVLCYCPFGCWWWWCCCCSIYVSNTSRHSYHCGKTQTCPCKLLKTDEPNATVAEAKVQVLHQVLWVAWLENSQVTEYYRSAVPRHPTFPARQESRCKCWRVGCLLACTLHQSDKSRGWVLGWSWAKCWGIDGWVCLDVKPGQSTYCQDIRGPRTSWSQAMLENVTDTDISFLPYIIVYQYYDIMNELNNIGRYWHVHSFKAAWGVSFLAKVNHES